MAAGVYAALYASVYTLLGSGSLSVPGLSGSVPVVSYSDNPEYPFVLMGESSLEDAGGLALDHILVTMDLMTFDKPVSTDETAGFARINAISDHMRDLLHARQLTVAGSQVLDITNVGASSDHKRTNTDNTTLFTQRIDSYQFSLILSPLQ